MRRKWVRLHWGSVCTFTQHKPPLLVHFHSCLATCLQLCNYSFCLVLSFISIELLTCISLIPALISDKTILQNSRVYVEIKKAPQREGTPKGTHRSTSKLITISCTSNSKYQLSIFFGSFFLMHLSRGVGREAASNRPMV